MRLLSALNVSVYLLGWYGDEQMHPLMHSGWDSKFVSHISNMLTIMFKYNMKWCMFYWKDRILLLKLSPSISIKKKLWRIYMKEIGLLIYSVEDIMNCEYSLLYGLLQSQVHPCLFLSPRTTCSYCRVCFVLPVLLSVSLLFCVLFRPSNCLFSPAFCVYP